MKELLHLIYWIACRAYWKKEIDCGSDYNKDICRECKHNDICDWQEQFETQYRELK